MGRDGRTRRRRGATSKGVDHVHVAVHANVHVAVYPNALVYDRIRLEGGPVIEDTTRCPALLPAPAP